MQVVLSIYIFELFYAFYVTCKYYSGLYTETSFPPS
jgi:hypothetical protein